MLRWFCWSVCNRSHLCCHFCGFAGGQLAGIIVLDPVKSSVEKQCMHKLMIELNSCNARSACLVPCSTCQGLVVGFSTIMCLIPAYARLVLEKLEPQMPQLQAENPNMRRRGNDFPDDSYMFLLVGSILVLNLLGFLGAIICSMEISVCQLDPTCISSSNLRKGCDTENAHRCKRCILICINVYTQKLITRSNASTWGPHSLGVAAKIRGKTFVLRLRNRLDLMNINMQGSAQSLGGSYAVRHPEQVH